MLVTKLFDKIFPTASASAGSDAVNSVWSWVLDTTFWILWWPVGTILTIIIWVGLVAYLARAIIKIFKHD